MIGLKSLLEDIIPFADILIFHNTRQLHSHTPATPFFHYFITSAAYNEDASFYNENRNKVILLADNTTSLNEHTNQFRKLDMLLPPEEMLRQLLQIQQHAHHGYTNYPRQLAETLNNEKQRVQETLSPREIEVIRLLTKGFINKEIAQQLNISINTVITHRKNIMQKLHSQSLSKLVIYAVTHGYVSADEIK